MSRCPTCGQITTEYRRTIHAEMVRFMVRLRDAGGIDEFVPIRDIYPSGAKSSSDASYLPLWDLVEKGGRGSYRLTVAGEAFLHGLVSVPKYAYVQCGELQDFSPEHITVSDVRKFNVEELYSPA